MSKRSKARRPGNRGKGGRPRVVQGPVATPELLEKRQRLTGLAYEDLMKQRAGVVLETLAARKVITEAQRLAGDQYGELVHRWRRMHAIPDGTRQRVGGRPGEGPSPEQVAKVDEAMSSATKALQSTTPIARAAVDSVCVDEEPGIILESNDIGDRLRSALRDGLDALCGVFRVARDRAA